MSFSDTVPSPVIRINAKITPAKSKATIGPTIFQDTSCFITQFVGVVEPGRPGAAAGFGALISSGLESDEHPAIAATIAKSSA